MLVTEERPPIDWREIAVAAAVAAAWIGVSLLPLRAIPRTAADAPGLDAHVYAAIAETPSVFTMPPFGYRIGVPWLVSVLPLPLEAGFFVVAAASLTLVLVLAYVLFRGLGFGIGLSLLGVSFVGAAPEVAIFLGNYFLVDPAACALVVLLILGVEKNWSDARMALLLLIGSLFKETAFFVLPALYVRRAGPGGASGSPLLRTLLVAAPALAAAFLLRFYWGRTDAEFPYLTPWSVPRRPWFGSMDSYLDLWRHLFSYLAILAAANAFTQQGKAFLRRYGGYLLLVLAQLVVPQNSERLLFFAFPVVVPLALVEFHRIKENLPDWFPLLASALLYCYLFVPGHVAAALALVLLGRFLIELRRRAA
jgi:hypothetical protein